MDFQWWSRDQAAEDERTAEGESADLTHSEITWPQPQAVLLVFPFLVSVKLTAHRVMKHFDVGEFVQFDV